MNRGYTLLWRKIRANPLLCESGKKFSRLEAWLYIINVLAAGQGLTRPSATDALNNISQIFRRQSKKLSKHPSFAGRVREDGGRASTGLLRIIYAVLEGKYDGPASAPTNGNGGNNAISSTDFDCEPGGTSTRRTSRGDPIYRPRQ